MFLSVNKLTVCQPHNLQREVWGLSRYGLKPVCFVKVERKKREGFDSWMVWR